MKAETQPFISQFLESVPNVSFNVEYDHENDILKTMDGQEVSAQLFAGTSTHNTTSTYNTSETNTVRDEDSNSYSDDDSDTDSDK